ncbi:CLUMA_CG007212, isoform A [Clunio marinus]|uniref:CLUMA_CG007212, isoform A n=1 Tax=Clunio marinus TaxID=568069 RepID=A0A1J1I0G3_9DIPT|nr:CLUMA_CG007212, isoform A [Clunio marinus]
MEKTSIEQIWAQLHKFERNCSDYKADCIKFSPLQMPLICFSFVEDDKQQRGSDFFGFVQTRTNRVLETSHMWFTC